MTKITCISVPPKYQDHDWVGKLERGLRRNTTREFKFECVRESQWPGWWAKMDLFPAEERTIYIDLDVLITGNVDFLFDYEGLFCVKHNPWDHYDMGLMSISAGYGGFIKDVFLTDPQEVMCRFRSDQEFIRLLAGKIDEWPRDKAKSYKADNLVDGPNGARVVMFHGEPKMDSFKSGWVREAWQ